MNHVDMIRELMACRSLDEMIDLVLAFATEIYEVGFAAGSATYD